MGRQSRALRGGASEGSAAERGGKSAGGGLPGEVYPVGGNGASGGPELVFGRMDPATRGRFLRMVHTTDGHVAGALWVVGGEVVYRRVLTDFGRHVLRVPVPSFCFDCGAALEARRAGATLAEVVDRASKRAWRVGFEHLVTHGELLDRGHGEQLRLAVTEFCGPSLSEEQAPAQASLFTEVSR